MKTIFPCMLLKMAGYYQCEPLRMQLVRCFGAVRTYGIAHFLCGRPSLNVTKRRKQPNMNAKLHLIGAKIAKAKACRDVFGSLWWSGAVIADILCEFQDLGFISLAPLLLMT